MGDKCIDCVLYKDGCTVGSKYEDIGKPFCADRQTPCITCGRPTHLQQCTNCRGVEWRIEEYLESEKGRALTREKLAEYEEYHRAY